MNNNPESAQAQRDFRKFIAVVTFVFSGALTGTVLLAFFIAIVDPQWTLGIETASWLLMVFLFYSLFATTLALPGFWLWLMAAKRLLGAMWITYPIAGGLSGALATLILFGAIAISSGDILPVWMFGGLNVAAGVVAGLAYWFSAGRPGRAKLQPTSS
mgnify:CR=1 FL=1